jgi:high-affinity iron transporter
MRDEGRTLRSDRTRSLFSASILVATGVVAACVIVWKAIAASGNPNPLLYGQSTWAATLDIGVLVFREGLECVLVLAAITSGMGRRRLDQPNPIALGVGGGVVATLATWIVAVQVLDELKRSVSALALQAATGLLAIVVLLVVMNWFFHKLYWTGWISMHNNRKRKLMERVEGGGEFGGGFFWGMALLGFTSFYREGFEVVLFLQSYRLRLGNEIVFWGVCIGMLLSGAVAVLTFLAHRRLPYRRMLVLTGILLGLVLVVMAGEQAQEMQLALWLPTTEIPWLKNVLSPWMGLWFSAFPTVETLAAQAGAAVLVLGSYFLGSLPSHKARSEATQAKADGPALASSSLSTSELKIRASGRHAGI